MNQRLDIHTVISSGGISDVDTEASEEEEEDTPQDNENVEINLSETKANFKNRVFRWRHMECTKLSDYIS